MPKSSPARPGPISTRLARLEAVIQRMAGHQPDLFPGRTDVFGLTGNEIVDVDAALDALGIEWTGEEIPDERIAAMPPEGQALARRFNAILTGMRSRAALLRRISPAELTDLRERIRGAPAERDAALAELAHDREAADV